MNNSFENHPYDPDFIRRYINDDVTDKEVSEFIDHLMTCELCRDERLLQLKAETLSEVVDLPDLMEKAGWKLERKDAPFDEESFQELINANLSSQESAKSFAERILKEINPPEGLGEFSTTWDYYFDTIFDWENSEYKVKDFGQEISETDMAFMPSLAEEPVITSVIRIIAEIKVWIQTTSKKNIENKLADLKNHLIDKNLRIPIIEKIIDTLF